MNLAPPVDLAATTCICWEGGLLRRRVPTLPLRGCWRLLPWPITSHVVSQHPIEKSRLVKTSSWELLLLCLSMVCRFCCNRLVLLLVKSNAIALLVISSLGMGNVEEGAKLRRILENAAGSPDASSETRKNKCSIFMQDCLFSFLLCPNYSQKDSCDYILGDVGRRILGLGRNKIEVCFS